VLRFCVFSVFKSHESRVSYACDEQRLRVDMRRDTLSVLQGVTRGYLSIALIEVHVRRIIVDNTT
jgi:hypothetical protein